MPEFLTYGEAMKPYTPPPVVEFIWGNWSWNRTGTPIPRLHAFRDDLAAVLVVGKLKIHFNRLGRAS
jgi:hypothetical protein